MSERQLNEASSSLEKKRSSEGKSGSSEEPAVHPTSAFERRQQQLRASSGLGLLRRPGTSTFCFLKLLTGAVRTVLRVITRKLSAGSCSRPMESVEPS